MGIVTNNTDDASSKSCSGSSTLKKGSREMVGGCCVCSDDRGYIENPLVYCDGQGCNVAVHQACYGIIDVPSGPWFCRKCESQERSAKIKCELCPSKSGALKRCENNGWAHVVCALYIPEVRFGSNNTMEPIILQFIPPERYNKTCYLCEEGPRASKASYGACMDCNKAGCKQYFHVTCAQAAGLLCEEAGYNSDNVIYCGYCKHHYSKLKKDDNAVSRRATGSAACLNNSGFNSDSTSDSSLDKATDGSKTVKKSISGSNTPGPQISQTSLAITASTSNTIANPVCPTNAANDSVQKKRKSTKSIMQSANPNNDTNNVNVPKNVSTVNPNSSSNVNTKPIGYGNHSYKDSSKNSLLTPNLNTDRKVDQGSKVSYSSTSMLSPNSTEANKSQKKKKSSPNSSSTKLTPPSLKTTFNDYAALNIGSPNLSLSSSSSSSSSSSPSTSSSRSSSSTSSNSSSPAQASPNFPSKLSNGRDTAPSCSAGSNIRSQQFSANLLKTVPNHAGTSQISLLATYRPDADQNSVMNSTNGTDTFQELFKPPNANISLLTTTQSVQNNALAPSGNATNASKNDVSNSNSLLSSSAGSSSQDSAIKICINEKVAPIEPIENSKKRQNEDGKTIAPQSVSPTKPAKSVQKPTSSSKSKKKADNSNPKSSTDLTKQTTLAPESLSQETEQKSTKRGRAAKRSASNSSNEATKPKDPNPAPSKRRSRTASDDCASPKKPRKKKGDTKANDVIPVPTLSNPNMQSPLALATSTTLSTMMNLQPNKSIPNPTIGNEFSLTSPYSFIDSQAFPKPNPTKLLHAGSENNNTSSDEHTRSFEELLKNHWTQTSKYILEQAQQFDLASLIGFLHTLKHENERLEERVRDLTARRDALLAMNARLDLPSNNLVQHLNGTNPIFNSLTNLIANSSAARMASPVASQSATRPAQNQEFNVSMGHPSIYLNGFRDAVSTPSPPINSQLAHATSRPSPGSSHSTQPMPHIYNSISQFNHIGFDHQTNHNDSSSPSSALSPRQAPRVARPPQGAPSSLINTISGNIKTNGTSNGARNTPNPTTVNELVATMAAQHQAIAAAVASHQQNQVASNSSTGNGAPIPTQRNP